MEASSSAIFPLLLPLPEIAVTGGAVDEVEVEFGPVDDDVAGGDA